MEKSNAKKIFDKIILGIFYVLCIIAFCTLADNLPEILNNFFNTNIFTGNESLFFLVCLIILGYVSNYFDEQKKIENEEYYQKRKNFENSIKNNN